MRKILAITLMSTLLLAIVPNPVLAGDTHAVSNRWTGVAIGASAAIVGGLLLNALQAPWATAPTAYAPPPVAYSPPSVVYNQPPVVYSPPPVIYTPPPAIYYARPPLPPVVYAPPPVVVHRGWSPPGYWNREHHEYRGGWDHH
jgi:hypothetical protein